MARADVPFQSPPKDDDILIDRHRTVDRQPITSARPPEPLPTLRRRPGSAPGTNPLIRRGRPSTRYLPASLPVGGPVDEPAVNRSAIVGPHLCGRFGLVRCLAGLDQNVSADQGMRDRLVGNDRRDGLPIDGSEWMGSIEKAAADPISVRPPVDQSTPIDHDQGARTESTRPVQ